MLVNILKPTTVNGVTTLNNIMSIGAYSVVWEEHFAKVGVAQVVFPNTTALREAVRVGRFFAIAHTQTLMYIQAVKINETRIWAYAIDAKGLYRKKALPNTTRAGEQDLIDAMEAAIRGNPISYVDDSMIIMYIMPDANVDDLDYDNVYDFVQGCLSLTNGGFYLSYRDEGTSAGMLIPYARQGVDKTATVMFSTVLGNARGIEVTDSDEPEYNTVVVIGEDTNGDPVTATVSDVQSGDVWSVVHDVRSEFPQKTETAAEYLAALQTRGRQSLAQRKRKYTVTVSDVDARGLGTAYRLGDTVSVALPFAQGNATATVEGVRRVSENGLDKTTLLLDDITVL